MAATVAVLRLAQRVLMKCATRSIGSCGTPPQPPPCECVVPAAPTCRTQSQRLTATVHRMCVAPSQGQAPPCKACEPSAPLTCATDIAGPTAQRRPTAPAELIDSSDNGCDGVAQRIAKAERERLLDYKREAALENPVQNTPNAFYHPREIAGAQNNHCRIRREQGADPCAHRPRVLLKIDRSAHHDTLSEVAPEAPAVDYAAKTRSRCERIVAPASTALHCRRPSILDRLKANLQKKNQRNLHSGVGDVGELIKVFRARDQLKEVGRGRIISSTGNKGNDESRATGALELAVPEGAHAVRVQVIMKCGETCLPHNKSHTTSRGIRGLCVRADNNPAGTKIGANRPTTIKTEQMKNKCVPRVATLPAAPLPSS